MSAPRPSHGREAGESLIEVMAAVVLLGVVAVPVSTAVRTMSQWIVRDTAQVQALAYAKQEVAAVRLAVLAAYAQAQAAGAAADFVLPAPPAPPAPRVVGGVTYTETVTGPTAPSWTVPGIVPLDTYTVTVRWQAGDGQTGAVALTFASDPAMAG